MYAAFKIMHWNACGLLARTNELKHFINTTDVVPDIICIQETFLKPKHNFKLDNYDIVRHDRIDQAKGGTATFVKLGIKYKVLSVPNTLDCVAVEIVIKNKSYSVVNVYNPPSCDIVVDECKPLFGFKNAIITGDFNAHNPLWENMRAVPLGKKFLNNY